MANLKTSIKDVRQNKRKETINKRIRRRYKDSIKSFEATLGGKDKKKAQQALSQAYKMLDKAAKNGVIKKNTASRKKSRLTKHFNSTFNKKAAPNVKGD